LKLNLSFVQNLMWLLQETWMTSSLEKPFSFVVLIHTLFCVSPKEVCAKSTQALKSTKEW
jgi:hypothetical protein